MCRHHRRCPGHQNTQGKIKHNQRRRDNRKIRRQIAAFAEQRSDVPENLDKMNIPDLKQWAREAGAGSEVLQPQESASPAPHLSPAASPTNHLMAGSTRPAHGRGPAPGGGGVVGLLNSPRNQQSQDDQYGHLASRERAFIADHQVQVDAMRAMADRSVWEERVLLDARVEQEIPMPKGGVNTTKKLQLEHGVVGYFKPIAGVHMRNTAAFELGPAEQAVHEAAAWSFAKQLGPEYSQLVAPCVLREHEGQLGSFSFGQSARGAGPTIHDSIKRLPPEQLRNAAFFDALTGQQDRHRYNLLVDSRGVCLIDHGYGFKKADDDYSTSILQEARSRSDDAKLTDRERVLLYKLLSSKDSMGLARVLSDERSTALRERAQWMLDNERIPHPGEV